jgi:thioredoxin reductase
VITPEEIGEVAVFSSLAPAEREQLSCAAAEWSLDRDPFLLETSVPGIFACGDVRFGPVKRVAAAVGEGSMSIAFVHQYLRELERTEAAEPAAS